MHFSYSCNGNVAICEKDRFGGCNYCWRMQLRDRLSNLVEDEPMADISLTCRNEALISLNSLESLVSKAESAIALQSIVNRIIDESDPTQHGGQMLVSDALIIEAGAIVAKMY